MTDILAEIIARKRRGVAAARQAVPLDALDRAAHAHSSRWSTTWLLSPDSFAKPGRSAQAPPMEGIGKVPARMSFSGPWRAAGAARRGRVLGYYQ